MRARAQRWAVLARLAPIALLAALLLLPGAGACLSISPAALEELRWLPDGALAGSTDLFWLGRVDLENGTARSELPARAVFSPDGRHVVFARVGPDVQTGPVRMESSCGDHLSRHLVAYDRETGTFALVEPGPVWGFAGLADGVVAFDGRSARVLAWGSWDLVREVRAPDVVEPLHFRGVVALAPDGASYVDDGELVSLDGRERRALAADAHRVVRAVWSPDGALLLVEAEIDATTSEWRFLRAEDLGEVKRERFAGERSALAWGPRGLAWIERAADPNATAALALGPGAPQDAPRLHRGLAPATWRAALAWSPDGARLAVSMPLNETHAHLEILDARLEAERIMDVVVLRADPAAWNEGLAQVPVPEYGLVDRPVPALGLFGVGLALALAVSLGFRADVSRPSRGTSRAPRP